MSPLGGIGPARRDLGACLGKRRKRELDDRDGRLDDGERDASVPRGAAGTSRPAVDGLTQLAISGARSW